MNKTTVCVNKSAARASPVDLDYEEEATSIAGEEEEEGGSI